MSKSTSIGKRISIVHRKSQIYFQQKLEPLGLSHGQVKVFVYLQRNPGARQNAICKYFHLDRSSTSFLINKMAKNDYVRKDVDPNDRRSQKLYLTDKAAKKQAVIKKTFKGWTLLLLKDFTQDEKRKAFEFMDRMIENVNFLNEDKKDS